VRTRIVAAVTALVSAGVTSAIWITVDRNIRDYALASSGSARVELEPGSQDGAKTNRSPASKPGSEPASPQPPAARSASTKRIGEVPDDLIAKHLTIPVQGIMAEQLQPDFYDERGQRGHEAIDIMAPRGQPVLAVEDGKIAKLFTSVRGGLTIYQFDPTEKYAYYYAHLDRYADGIAAGDSIRRGQVIGYVGSTGNAGESSPHLHFAIFLLGPEKLWWQGEALDPYPALVWR
jgi:murein DD-endopeptidase MepM/ murein hydrolase activator NlpD